SARRRPGRGPRSSCRLRQGVDRAGRGGGVTPRRPLRLAFVGVGWIGRHRMQALLGSGLAKALAVADAAPEARAAALELTPGAASAESLEQVLDLGLDLDGVVIATPSALHAAQ